MKPGGVLLAMAGVWVLCQVLAGNALQRLGLQTDPAAAADSEWSVPDRGYADVPHDANGRPL